MLNHMYRCRQKNRKSKWILRDIAVVEIFFATGARVYEISNMKLDSMDLESGLIRIMGKGGKERYIQIGESEMIDLLQLYYRECESEAGIQRKITPHMFRHSFATYLIEEGVDISCVQQILGHSSIKTTQIYIHVAARKQAEILKMKHPRKQMKIVTAA